MRGSTPLAHKVLAPLQPQAVCSSSGFRARCGRARGKCLLLAASKRVKERGEKKKETERERERERERDREERKVGGVVGERESESERDKIGRAHV